MAARTALDQLIGWFSPKRAYQRAVYREAMSEVTALQQRRYGGAAMGRLNGDWRGAVGSGDARLAPDLGRLIRRSRQLETDNGYATAAVRNLTVGLTFVDARAIHDNPRVAKKAQAEWDRFKKERGFLSRQKVAIREMILGGSSLTVWRAKKGSPDARVDVLPAEQLDVSKTEILPNGNRVRLGVEVDMDGDVVAYWIFPEHPGDLLSGLNWTSERIEAQYVDHLFDELWAGQSRGVPWFYGALIDLDEIHSLEDALRIKKKVEACFSAVRKRTLPDGESPKPLGHQAVGPDGRMLETLSPGMVATLEAGEDLVVLNPSSSGDGDKFHKSQLMKASAALGVPYHLVTGDVSEANYSSLRADEMPFQLRLEDWIHLTVAPKFCEGWFTRCMRLAAVKTGDKRLLDVQAEWSAPPRPWVDPLKDIMAEKLRLRLYPGSLPEAMARQGRDWRAGIDTEAEVQAYAKERGVIYDASPVQTDMTGKVQMDAAETAVVADTAKSKT